jgi:hypothetical protein
MTWKVIAIYAVSAVIWEAILENAVSADTISNLKGAPPLGLTGQMVLWPWGLASFLYSQATS